MTDGVRDVVEEYDLAAYPLAFGAKVRNVLRPEGPQLPGLPGAR